MRWPGFRPGGVDSDEDLTAGDGIGSAVADHFTGAVEVGTLTVEFAGGELPEGVVGLGPLVEFVAELAGVEVAAEVGDDCGGKRPLRASKRASSPAAAASRRAGVTMASRRSDSVSSGK